MLADKMKAVLKHRMTTRQTPFFSKVMAASHADFLSDTSVHFKAVGLEKLLIIFVESLEDVMENAFSLIPVDAKQVTGKVD